MIILGIETSCDDTAIAVLRAEKSNFKILSNIVSSQIEIHRKYGGVYPTLAKREHQKNLVPVLEKALKKAGFLEIFNSQFSISNFQKLKQILEREEYLFKQLEKFFKKYKKPKIDVVAVTIGPGLEPCLWAGVNFAKALGYFWKVPVIPVNHIEGHIIVNFVDKAQMSKLKSQIFPAVALVVSGGHTQLVLVEKIGRYKIIGETRDDAAGECFDKTARILGLPYPGGPAIAREAEKLQTTKRSKTQANLPRPMIHSKDYDFSFSGLKTAVLYEFRKRPKKVRESKEYIREMAREIQQSIIDILIKKTIKAAKEFKARTIILGGGVVANKELRKQFEEKIKKEFPDSKLLIPDLKFCTDNAVMIAVAAYFNKNKKSSWKNLEADANLRLG